MDTVLNSIIVLFWAAFFLATLIGLFYSFRKTQKETLTPQKTDGRRQ